MGELEPQRPGLGPRWLEAWAAAHPLEAPADEEPALTDNVLVFRRHCPPLEAVDGAGPGDATGWPV